MSELASLLVSLARGRERYVTLHYLPMTSDKLADVITSTGRGGVAPEYVVLSDDDLSLQFLEMVSERL